MELWSIAVTGFLFVVFAFLYFIPTMVAVERKHPHTGAIFLLNLLMGLSGIGWVAAFIWAFISTPQSGQVIVTHQMPMPPPPRRIEPANWEADKELPAWLRQ